MIRRMTVFLLTAALGPLSVLAAAPTGSCLSAAESFKFASTNPNVPNRKAVHLTSFYDEGTGTTVLSNQVYFLKATLSRGKEYTVWLENADGKAINISEVEPVPASEESELFEPGAMFAQALGKWGSRYYLSAEEWTIDEDDPEMSDPASWTYYFQLSGAKGETATFCYVQNVALPDGIDENPTEIYPTESEERHAFGEPHLFVTNEFSYVFQVNFKEGHRYLFVPEGGTVSDPYGLSYGGGKVTRYAPWESEGNAAMSFDPDQDGPGTFVVDHSTNGSASATFNLRFGMLPQRTMAQHNPKKIAFGESVTIAPAHVNDTGNKFYDKIIDGPLFSFQAEQGKRYLVETTGAQTNLLMRIYSKDGSVLHENKGLGDGSGNVRCGFKATESGTHYVGVAVNLDDDDNDDPGVQTAVLQIRSGESVKNAPDMWDDADDEPSGATVLTAWPYGKDVTRQIPKGTNFVSIAVEPTEVDKVGTDGWHQLGGTDWYDTFVINAREGLTYRLRVIPEREDAVFSSLSAEVYILKGKSKSSVKTEGTVSPPGEVASEKNQPLTFTAKKNAPYYIRLKVRDGLGVIYPNYKVYAAVYDPEEESGLNLGRLKVNVRGPIDATWSPASESSAYVPGVMTLDVGSGYGVKFASVKGFTTPSAISGITVTHDGLYECEEAVYIDQSDPKDDDRSGAVKWSIGSNESSQSRTLWATDPEDWFVFAGKDDALFDFTFAQDGDQDAVFSIINENEGISLTYTNSVKRLELPSSKSKYYLVVRHADAENPRNTSYVLSALSAVVGDIKFAKTAVTAKDTATSVKLTVNRTAKDGIVRVRYSTVDGTAKAGTNYVAQTGVLEWANGDKKAKTITVKLIPKLLAAWNGGDKDFTVALEQVPLQDDGDYEASIPPLTSVATVTLKETSNQGVTAADVYAKKQPKKATVKTETGVLRGGTFYGIVRTADAAACSNDLPAVAAITLTVSARGGIGDTSKDTLSAKVAFSGKTYSLKAKKGEVWTDAAANPKTARLTADIKVSKVSYTVALDLAVVDGTIDESSWTNALATAKLTVSKTDSGAQPDLAYAGRLYRQNAKIQSYLDAVWNFAGYYTVALANPNADAKVAPAGHGYLTMTVDSKGKTKVAGLLADSTKVSLSVTAAALRLTNGVYELVVPVYASKTLYSIGGELAFKMKKIVEAKPTGEMTNPDGKDFDIVVGASERGLFWGNSNEALTYAGTNGWALTLQPVGGWYDTVFNLQNYYKNATLGISTSDLSAFPTEVLADGYSFVTDEDKLWQPNGYDVEMEGNSLKVDKKKIVKDADRNTDLVNSVNPYNVQLKFARATGIVSGSFSLWSQNDQGTKKEITGIKHYGVLLQQRDDTEVLPGDYLTVGFFNQKVKVKDGTRTRNWTFSKPFNIVDDVVETSEDLDE